VLPNVQGNKEVSPDLPGFYTEIKKQDKSKSMLFPIILNGLTYLVLEAIWVEFFALFEIVNNSISKKSGLVWLLHWALQLLFKCMNTYGINVC